MKLHLKLVLAVTLVIGSLSCRDSGKAEKVVIPPAVSYRESRSELRIDTPSQGIYNERRNYTSRGPSDSTAPLNYRGNFERMADLSPEQRAEMRRLRDNERTENIAWVKEAVKKFSPGSWHMLMEYEKLPEETEIRSTDDGNVYTAKAAGTFHYLKGRDRIDLLASMETNVHEIAHAYFDQNSYKYLKDNGLRVNMNDARGFIYISPEENYYVSFPLKSMFPSGDLKSHIPEKLRTYRYDTYIEGSTSTQSDGVIGLLNELNAYYLGSEYCYNMLAPYREAAGSDAGGLFEWVTHTQSTMSAFYEFDFFIKEYLLLMKTDRRSDYQKLKEYEPFRKAYTTLLRRYSALIEDYRRRIDDEADRIIASGTAGAGIEKGWLWIRVGNSHVSSGTPVFSEERDVLLSIIKSNRFRDIEKDFPW